MPFSKKLIFLFILSALFGCGRKEADDGVGVAVVPTFFQLPSGGEVQLAADVSGTLNKDVTWEVNGPLGTSISSGGLFRAPLNADGQTATIRAISQDDPNASGNAAITMTAFSKLDGENLPAGFDTVIAGGYTIRAGQTIDLNGDNVLDLISVSRSGGLAFVYLGVGGGLFRKQAEIQVSGPSAVTTGDFVNSPDFVADIAIASRGEQAIKIISGTAGDANSPFPVGNDKITTLPLSGEIPSALAAGRFHGDVESRNSDLVVGTEEGAIVLFLQDRSTGHFNAQPAISVGGKVTRMVPEDFNGDALLDVAVLREGASDVLILLGNGAGAFSEPISVPFTSPPTSLDVGDLNGDKIVDLVAAHSASNQVSTSIGKGDGTFLPTVYLPVDSSPGSIVVEDLNLDRMNETANRPGNPMLDLAIAFPVSREVLLLFGDGTGKFIGNLRYHTGTTMPRSLISGFFLSFDNQTGFQNVSLVYLDGNTNTTQIRFYLLNNVSF